MKIDIFAQDYKKKLEQEVISKSKKEDVRLEEKISEIEEQYQTAPETIGLVVYGGIAGFLVGCYIGYNGLFGFEAEIGNALLAGMICMAIGSFLANEIRQLLEVKTERYNDKFKKIIEEERTKSKIKKEYFLEEADKQYKEYLAEIENDIQNLSIRFAESELAKEVIEWMTTGFCRTIDSADRKSYVSGINVPFVFLVYKNKIKCNIGTYDFKVKRCRNLVSPLEQIALARAIASAIQLNIVMKYPKDESGTDVKIYINYDYTMDYPETTITYVASNGNFKAVQDW